MTSMDVAVATSSTKVATPVASRELLWDGGTIEIEVPTTARPGDYSDENIRIHFVHFARSVKGGLINFFVHGDTAEDTCGNVITAQVKIYCKTFVDNRSYLYVDLVPTSDMKATHRLMEAVHSNLLPEHLPDGVFGFKTPEPLQGALVVVPVDQQFDVRPKSAKPPAHSSRDYSRLEQKGSGTGDAQLDRLLADGWTISHDGGAIVGLEKGTGDKRRTMTHHRPQPKLKKNKR